LRDYTKNVKNVNMSHSQEPKKNILFLITKSSWGGAQRYVYDMANTLSKDKYTISVALGGNGPLALKLKEKGVRIIQIPWLKRDVNILYDIIVFFHLVFLLKRESPDIVHLNSSKIGGLGSFAARLVGIEKIIFTGHGWAFEEERSKISKNIIIFFHWLTVVFSHYTIAVSEATRQEIIKRFRGVDKKIVTIHNGIGNYEALPKDKARKALLKTGGSRVQKAIQLLGKYEDIMWIGTVAELHPNKGLDFALRAFGEFLKNENNKMCVYFILGDGEEKNNLKELLKKYNLESRVFLLDHVPEANTVMKAFDVFILPSRKEAFPYVLLESGKLGVATMASNVGGISELIESGRNGMLIRRLNISDFKKSLETLLNDQMRKTLGLRLRQKVQEEFSLEKMAVKTQEVYEK